MEVDDLLPVDYVEKHSDEELMVLNDVVSIPSSSEPSTPVHGLNKHNMSLVLHWNKKVPQHL